MSISSVQSGYSTVAYMKSVQKTSDSAVTYKQTTTHSINKAANNTYHSEETSTSRLSGRMSDVLLQHQKAERSGLYAISRAYDVTNLSGYERIAMAHNLRDNGLISKGADMALIAPLSMDEDLSAKTNYLDTARKAYEFASKHGASGEQLAIEKERLDILERLNTLST